jgi:hypothetical protein
MNKFLISSLAAVFLVTAAMADTSSIDGASNMGVLENNWVKAGVNKDAGTFGSGGNTSPGLLFDPTGTGTFDAGFDYLTPGSPFDGFSVKIDGSNYANNNASWGGADIAATGALTDGDNTLSWGGSWTHDSSTWSILNTFTLGANNPFVDVTSVITAGSAADDLWFGKFIDPDSQGMPGDSSSTDNVLGYSGIPSTNVAFSEATVSRYALGLYSTDANTAAGINGWSSEADSYVNADASCGTGILYCNADDTIGLSWHWVNVSAGDILTASYAYIFGPSAFDAADSAVTGGAGGGTPGELPTGWTLTDVGSATDAAAGGGTDGGDGGDETPTIVSTDTETLTEVTEAPSATLPVLTASITHHDSSVASGVQTIARETTTTTTTPIEVTTTSVTENTDTYSDGSIDIWYGPESVVTDVRNDVTTAVTHPVSFIGRMDQVNAMLDLSLAHNLSFGQGINAGIINGSTDTGYTADTQYLSLGGNITTDNGLVLGGGFVNMSADLTGNNSTGTSSTTKFGVMAGKEMETFTITGAVNTASTDLVYSRTIGTFATQGSTSASDSWASIELRPNTDVVHPILGYTFGTKSTDGYAETGSVQAILLNNGFDGTYGYATFGADVDVGLVNLNAVYNTDGSTKIGISVNKDIGKASVSVSATQFGTETSSSTSLGAGLSLQF